MMAAALREQPAARHTEWRFGMRYHSTCLDPLCTRLGNLRGYCKTHYTKLYRAGELPARDLFWDQVEKTPTCWLWTGTLGNGGYGRFGQGGRYVHRLAYEQLIGPIPNGLTLDHLCRVRNCVNPSHLEAVTQAVNMSRSPFVLQTQNAAKTHCLRGHPFDEANTYIMRGGWRRCRACKRLAWHRNKKNDPRTLDLAQRVKALETDK